MSAEKLFPSNSRSERIRPSPEWLREKYEIERLDCTALAKILQVDPKTAWVWVREAGIETRKRGFGHPENLFKPGQISPWKGHVASPELRDKIRRATMARGGVPYLRNGVHWLRTVPIEQNPNWKGGATPERQTFYRSDEWKACVKIIWTRDDATCQRCRLDHRTIVRGSILFHIHHIDSFVIVERRADPDNLVLLCKPCHNWVHSKENADRIFLGKGQEFGAPPILYAQDGAA
jgi:hypothetical protein